MPQLEFCCIRFASIQPMIFNAFKIPQYVSYITKNIKVNIIYHVHTVFNKTGLINNYFLSLISNIIVLFLNVLKVTLCIILYKNQLK